ncbi:MAG: transglutaminase-like domain-containing protein [Lachnospiraceae bacterium]|nr:transglutaminase-like domain-containing protein [Lachnospiraceae bacterium]
MNRANAEETLANVFASAGKEADKESIDKAFSETEGSKKHHVIIVVVTLLLIVILILLLTSCGKTDGRAAIQAEAEANMITGDAGTRDCVPVCLVPEAPGEKVEENDLVKVDISNMSEGYVIVSYFGDCQKVKLQITGPNEVTYTFNCKGGGEQEVFPLAAGDGTYMIAVYENVEGTQYAAAYTTEVDVTLADQTRPFLYPNQYVDFNENSKAVAVGVELAKPCSDDLEVVTNVYNYMISNITYDAEEAESVQSGYIPVVDDVLERKTGICLDYAALMATMLRSQRIPTRLEVGYAGIAYHAWISTYIGDIGWVNGIVEFDGHDWQLMDPTFAANSSVPDLKSFIGNGDNYELKYSY